MKKTIKNNNDNKQCIEQIKLEQAGIQLRLDNDFRYKKHLDGEYTPQEWSVIAAERREMRQQIRDMDKEMLKLLGGKWE